MSGLLNLQGDISVTGDVLIDTSGTVIPAPLDLIDTIYSCPTQDFAPQNGKTPSIISSANITLLGTVNGVGYGFPPNEGPGANSTLLDSQYNLSNIYGANHAGIGFVSDVPGSVVLIEEYFTVNSLNMLQKDINLSYKPIDGIIAVNIIDGPALLQDTDFFLNEDKVSWAATPIEFIMAEGDELRVIYLADTSRYFLDPKKPYGSYEAPTSIGSGSGETSGGSGLKLEAQQGEVYLGGIIDIDGEEGLSVRTGGGSGGSLWVSAYSIDGTGPITAQGGSATYEYAGGGGGGYITLNYENYTDYNGSLSVLGSKGGSKGIITVKKIQPFFIDKFTGTVLNSKWWEVIDEPLTLDNKILMDTAVDETNSSRLNSVFEVSGNNIQMDLDYSSSGNDTTSYSSYFQLFQDTTNWVSVTKRFDGIHGMSSVGGTVSDSSVLHTDNISTTFRLLKNDSTFSFQYIDTTSLPVTIATQVIPTFEDLSFKVGIGHDKTGADDTLTSSVHWDNFKVFTGIVSGSETPEPVLYVDPINGSDSSDGCILTPLQNLFVATAWAKRNSTVVLYSGEHNPTEVINKNLTIAGANGSNAIITSINSSDTTGSNWENSCLTFRDCQGLVKNVILSDASTAILAQNVKNLEINSSTLKDSSEGIKFTDYSKDCRVVANTFKDIGNGIIFESQNYNPLIYSNVAYDCSTVLRMSDATNFIISSNTFDSDRTGVLLDNTSMGVIASTNLTGLSVGVLISGDSTVGLFNNNYHATTDPKINAGGYIIQDTSFTYGSPNYVNQFLRNYNLSSSSPNKGTGTGQFDPIYLDRNRNSRTPSYDIGAYQYSSATPFIGDHFVDASGDNFYNNGSNAAPYLTIDKAMLTADSPVYISSNSDSTSQGTHLNTYFLNLKEQNIYFVDTSRQVQTYTLDSHYSNIDISRLIFVSPNGSDGTVLGGDGTNSGGNGTVSLPYRSLGLALENSIPGDYIIAMSGEYESFNGVDNRVIVPVEDRTGVTDGRVYLEDLFWSPLTVYPNHNTDETSWNVV